MDYEKKLEELKQMLFVSKIFHHPRYQKYLHDIEELEAARIYCHHDLVHFLDVARIAYILNFERGYGLEKEMIYLAALLHDIGRWKQYEDGTPHNQASTVLAKEFLEEAAYPAEKMDEVLDAILCHGSKGLVKEKNELSKLAEVIKEGDKVSRGCYGCKAEETCDWSVQKKNMEILW